MSQLQLLPSRKFGPLFWTQFLGAFNDNLFKNALVIMITFQSASLWGLGPENLVVLCAGLFILPFFLLSATAGQLSDKYSKSMLMRWVKAGEIGIMCLAAVGFFIDSLALLLSVLFLMGVQSAFFGPAKYSVLPELLAEDELVGGNALVETGTFLSILLGTIAGGLMAGAGDSSTSMLATSVLLVSIAGWCTSLLIPKTPGSSPDMVLSLNPVTPTLQTFQVVRENRPVFLSVLGISWFWFLGASLLTLFPTYTKTVLFGNESVVTFLLSLFCIGMAIGALLCERLSDKRLELGLVPFGSIGITLFVFDLGLVGEPYDGATSPASLLGLGGFLTGPDAWRIVIDFTMLSIFSGFYTVPLYTMIQQRTQKHVRARVVAGNNILNALFMVGSALTLMALYELDFSFSQIFVVLAVSNALVALYIYTVIPEFLLRFVAWILANLLYRVHVTGREHIPAEGPALIVCNHVTFIDWLIIASVVKRPARFVMHYKYFSMPLVRFLFRDAKVIPIAPAHEDAETLDAAFDQIAAELEAGEIVCIFPEGKLTRDGKMNPFRNGVERILARTPVPVLPMALVGLWRSLFSHHPQRSPWRPFRHLWAKVSLHVGEQIAPTQANAANLTERVAKLGEFELPKSG